jgi:hypothetical protein
MAYLPGTVWSSDNNSYFGAAVGQTGPQGQQGPVGPTGLSIGLPGVQGVVGLPGSTNAGPTGATGPQGPQGFIGPQGLQGTSAGASGPTGPAGEAGPQGSSSGSGQFLGIPNTVICLSGGTQQSDILFTNGFPLPGYLNVPAINVAGYLINGPQQDGYSFSPVAQANSNSSLSCNAATAPLTIASVPLYGGLAPSLNKCPALVALCSVQIQNQNPSVLITTDQALMNIGIQIDSDATNAVYGGSVYCPARQNAFETGYNNYIGTGGAAVILLSNVNYTSNSQVANLVIQSQPAFSGGWPGYYAVNFSVIPI